MKTESSSFRLDKEVFTEFKKHAKKQHLTTNSLINKIMKEYVDWSAIIPAVQFVPISASLIVKLLRKHSEEDIRKAARAQVEEHLEENLLMLKNEASIESYLEAVENWCDASGFPISSREKSGVTNYTVRHNHGKKFSVLLEEEVKTAIEILTEEKAKTKLTTNSISFWV